MFRERISMDNVNQYLFFPFFVQCTFFFHMFNDYALNPLPQVLLIECILG